jgi:hypothetical protein
MSNESTVSFNALKHGLLKDGLITGMDKGEPLGGSSDSGIKQFSGHDARMMGGKDQRRMRKFRSL